MSSQVGTESPSARTWPWRKVLALWLVTRCALLVLLIATASTPLASDLLLFSQWSEQLATGRIPSGDMWQYPPGMALLLGAIGAFGLGMAGLLMLILAADFGILAALRATPGGRYWAWAPALMGPLVLTRMDMVVTFFAVRGLAPGVRAARSGVLLGLGAALKLWPGSLIAALPLRRVGVRATAAALVYGTGAALAWALFGRDGFLANQGARGLQIEAVAAWPFLIAQRFGAPVEIVFRNGTNEIESPLADSVAAMLPIASLASVAAIAWVSWRRNPTGPVATRALALVCLLLVTSRVLSPQFNIWILGMVAVAVAHGVVTRSVVITAAITALAATAYYPFLYSLDNTGLTLQTIRVASLVWLTAVCVKLAVSRRDSTSVSGDTWVPMGVLPAAPEATALSERPR